jgi:hypothetical protein
MWASVLPPDHLKQAITQFVHEAPTSFVQLGRVLPQIRGTEDLVVSSGFILWRGLSADGVEALQSLHSASAIFFWLCSPEIYARSGDAPFLRLVSRSHRAGEQPWLPTMIHDRAPTAMESRKAVKEYVAEIARYAQPRR